MKNILKKYSIIIIVTSLFGCGNTEDPLNKINLETLTKDQLLNKLLEDDIIYENEIGEGEDFDLVAAINKYRYVLKEGDFTYEFITNFDKEIYDFGKSRSLKLSFSSASEEEAKKIFSIYSKWYGKPSEDINGNLEWKDDNVRIFYSSEFYHQFESRILKYYDAKFEERNQQIKDSIEQSQTFEKLVLINETKGFWKEIGSTKRSFGFNIRISRREKFDYREINSIRFNFVIKDEFGEELYRKNDITVELQIPMGALKDRVENDPFYTILSNDMKYDLTYSIYDTNYHSLEKARLYSLQNRVFFDTEITKVALSDGSVLSR